MNKILILGNNNNDYLKLTLNAFKLPYTIIENKYDLSNLKLVTDDYSLVIKSNTIIRREFNIHLYELLQYRKNLIVGYDYNLGLNFSLKFPNILKNYPDIDLEKSSFLDKIKSIPNNINSNNVIDFKINSFILNNKIIQDFEKTSSDNKIVNNNNIFTDLFNFIIKNEKELFNNNNIEEKTFNEITYINYFKSITYTEPGFKILQPVYYLFSDLIKKCIIKKYNNNLNDIFKNIYNLNYGHTDINIMCKNIFNSNKSVIIIFNNNLDEILKIIDNISKSYLNTVFNTITIITENENIDLIKKDILTKKVIKSEHIKFIKNTNKLNTIISLFDNINYSKDIYLLTYSQINLNCDFTNILNKLFINQIFNYQNICFKFNKYLVSFFKLIPTIINKYLNEEKFSSFSSYHCLNYIQQMLATISNKYFITDVYNINLNYNKSILEVIEIDDLKLDYLEDFLEEMYDKKEYDIVFKCISYLFINNIPTEQSIIFKYIAISPYTNYQYSFNDYKTLFNLLTLKSEIEIINIFNILFFSNHENTAIMLLFENMNSSYEIKESNISLYCILAFYSGSLDKTIDITNDITLLTEFIENLIYIKSYLKSDGEGINSTLDTDKIYNSILNFILSRINLLDSYYVEKFNTVYYTNKSIKNINVMSDNEIYELIRTDFSSSLNIGMCLSDVMITSEDILLQREISKRYVSVLEKFIDTEIENIDIKNTNSKLLFNLLNLFKYSYHGIPNRDFFIKSRYCFKTIYKYKLIESNTDLINNLVKEGVLMDKEDNFFNYKFKDTNPKKILFISEFLDKRHSVFKDRHQVIKYLANNGFEVYLGLTNNLNYQFSNIFKGIKGIIILNPVNLLDNVKKIRKHNFDKIIFCEVGMSSICTLLSHFKLGRVTFNTWGHSDTSGCNYIDYYVSSKYYELPYEQSKEHYSEELILQNGLCTAYVNPVEKYELKIPRTFFGLSKHDKIILCPQSLFKIYPDYDEYLFEILYRLPDVNLVFVDAMDKKYKMYDRWDNKMDKKYHGILSRVKFIPGVSHEKFVNLINNSNIMLDPYPFGGCNTSFEGFACGIPIITQRADVINGRFTAGFYEYMGFTDLIAKDKEDYINLTCKLINNNEFYNYCVKQIKDNSHKLFMDQQTLIDWKALMETK